jgi:4-amino-4-deoxy-L-arabinose transferase-like glycosyltransferase
LNGLIPRLRNLATTKWGIWLIFGLALAVRLLWLLALAPGGRANFDDGDYALYDIGARHLVEVGDFSNSLFLHRPPLFILQVVLLGGHIWAIMLVNAVLGALGAVAAVWLARRLGLSAGAAALAGVIVALDPSTIHYSVFLGPESLANLLLTLGVAALLRGLQGPSRSPGWLVLAGLALGLSSITRPATYLLWIPLLLWQAFAHRREWRRVLVPLAGFALLAVLPPGLWALHNGLTFNQFTVSTVTPYTMLYYRAASVENLAGGYESMDALFLELNRRVEAEMGRDPELATLDSRHGYLTAAPELAAAMNRISMEIFLEHPALYVATIPVGFARLMGLLPAAIRQPGDALLWLWNGVFLALTALGLLRAVIERRWTLFFGVGLVMAYYIAGTLMVKSAGMNTRERTMLTPFMAAASVVALEWLRGWWAGRRGQLPELAGSEPADSR